MKLLIWLASIGVALYLLHRLALWAESRGYIYYLNTEPSRGTLGNAFLQSQSLLEPGKRAMVEAMHEEQAEQDESGAPPEAGEQPSSDTDEGRDDGER